MSHTVKIEVKYKVTELPQLRKAFSVLGWTTADNASARQYAGRQNYDVVAVNPDTTRLGFDIGMTRQGENLDMFSDFYGGSIENSLGTDCSKLKQEFAAAVIADEFPNATIDRTVDERGNMLLSVEQW